MIEAEKLSDHEFAELYRAYLRVGATLSNIVNYIRTKELADDKFLLCLYETNSEVYKLWLFAVADPSGHFRVGVSK